MAETIRGDGLMQAHRALYALQQDPRRLEIARRRFSKSPPPYFSCQSLDSTLSPSPNPTDESERRREAREWRLKPERNKSRPHYQLSAQEREEEKQLREADRDGTCPQPARVHFGELACKNVKKRWVEQGIWNDKWNEMVNNERWKHEEPPEPDSESETEMEANLQTPLFSFGPPKPRRPKSDEEKRQSAERRATRAREREASRPFHQFVYQLSRERERIQQQANSEEVADTDTPSFDINTRAYENVKNTWTKRYIWNRKWGILPGMTWKHEDPLDLNDEPIAADPYGIFKFNNEAGQAPEEATEEPPSPPELTSHLDVCHNFECFAGGDTTHCEAPGIPITSQQGQAAPRDSAKSTHCPVEWNRAFNISGSFSPAETNHDQALAKINTSQQGLPNLDAEIGKALATNTFHILAERIHEAMATDTLQDIFSFTKYDQASDTANTRQQGQSARLGNALLESNSPPRTKGSSMRLFEGLGTLPSIETNHNQASGTANTRQQGQSARLGNAPLQSNSPPRSPMRLFEGFKTLPPVETNHSQASSPINTSQQGQPARIDSARSENPLVESNSPPRSPMRLFEGFKTFPPVETNNNPASSTKNSTQQGQPAQTDSASLATPPEWNPPPKEARHNPHPTKTQPQQTKRKPSTRTTQTRAAAIPSPPESRIFKVSKTPTKKKPAPRRELNSLEDILPSGPSKFPTPETDTLEPPFQTATPPPRRSPRLQKPSVADDRSVIASMATPRSSRKRTGAGEMMSVSPAKPKGVTKNTGARKTRQTARKSRS